MVQHANIDHSGLTGIGTATFPVYDEGVSKGTASAGLNLVGTYVSGTVTSGTAVLTFATPPGHQYEYTAATASVLVTPTTEAGATAITQGGSIVYDGSTVLVEFFATGARPAFDVAGRRLDFALFEGSSSIGTLGTLFGAAAAVDTKPVHLSTLRAPSGTVAYSVRAYVSAGTGVVSGGNGGPGTALPAFMRITKV